MKTLALSLPPRHLPTLVLLLTVGLLTACGPEPEYTHQNPNQPENQNQNQPEDPASLTWLELPTPGPLFGTPEEVDATAVYYDSTLYGSTPEDTGGTALTTPEFANTTSFPGFDFTDTWILSTAAPTRPVLQ